MFHDLTHMSILSLHSVQLHYHGKSINLIKQFYLTIKTYIEWTKKRVKEEMSWNFKEKFYDLQNSFTTFILNVNKKDVYKIQEVDKQM